MWIKPNSEGAVEQRRTEHSTDRPCDRDGRGARGMQRPPGAVASTTSFAARAKKKAIAMS